MDINISNFSNNKLTIILFVIVLLVYGNSINNEYAIDDSIVTRGLSKIENGIDDIPAIFSTHYIQDDERDYGYRPIVLLTFALEKEFFSSFPEDQTELQKDKRDRLTQANISHFLNVVIYILIAFFLFRFLRKLLVHNHILIPFFITLLFLVHPIHTEPVANIKSRDELLMLLFFILALDKILHFAREGKTIQLVYCVLFSIISILSKKSAFALLGVIPVVLFFDGTPLKKIALGVGGFVLAFACVLAMKKGLLNGTGKRGLELYESPLVQDHSFIDRILLGMHCSWHYFGMLLFPKDMSFYYGYSEFQIPKWSTPGVWIGLIIHLPLTYLGIKLLLKRKILGLGIILWLGIMLAYLNVLTPAVGVVADRFANVFSLGFIIALISICAHVFKYDLDMKEKAANPPKKLIILFISFAILGSIVTINRNNDWERDLDLYRADIGHIPNSIKAHSLIADCLFEALPRQKNPNKAKAMLEEMIGHYERTIALDPNFKTAHNNLGTVYFDFLRQHKKAIPYFENAHKLDPSNVSMSFNLARCYDLSGNIKDAEKLYMSITSINSPNHDSRKLAKMSYSYWNLMLLKANKMQKMFEVNKLATKAFPMEPEFYLNLGNLYLGEHDTIQGLTYYEKGFELDQSNQRLIKVLSKLYSKSQNTERAVYFNSLLAQ